MKRRAVCFLLCLCFCFCSVSLKSSAVDDYNSILAFPDDYIDMGYERIDDYNYFSSGSTNSISLYTTTSKNYDFNPKIDIPWNSFPDYIKNIVYMDCGDLKKTEGDFSVPFVSAVVVSQTTVQIFVGLNVGWGEMMTDPDRLCIWSLPEPSSISSQSRLYRFSWNYKNSTVVSDWTQYTGELFGNKNNLIRMLNYYFDSNSFIDMYCYGGNGLFYYGSTNGTNFSGRHALTYNTSGDVVLFGYSQLGFVDTHYIVPYPQQFPHYYLEYFVPPDENTIIQQEQNQLQQEQNELIEEGNETSKGIWETLKGIPEAIGEKIKGLFVPSEGFFDTYQQEFQTYFRERFGILYEIPELVISLLQKFITFNPKEDDYSITFPEVKLPVLEDGEWREEKLIEAQEFSFDFINEAPFSLLYDAYVAFIWLVYILLLVNLIKNKANSVFKGG